MRTLNWEDYLGDPAVHASYTDLKRLAIRRAIKLHSLSLTPKQVKPFRHATREAHHIFIAPASPTAHQSLVHEITHGILDGGRLSLHQRPFS